MVRPNRRLRPVISTFMIASLDQVLARRHT